MSCRPGRSAARASTAPGRSAEEALGERPCRRRRRCPDRAGALIAALLFSFCFCFFFSLPSCSSSPEEQTPAEWLRENTTLLEKLRSYEAEERIEAINAFKSVGKERGTRYALTLLHDRTLDDYRIEVVLARILADWQDRRAIPFLLEALRRPDEGAVEIAKEGLAVFHDDPTLVDALGEMVKSPVLKERRAAAEVLSKTGGSEVVELFGERYLAESDPEVRAFFLMAISDSRHPRRVRYLIDALTDPDASLRQYAWNVLERSAELPEDAEFDPYAPPAERARVVAMLRLWADGGNEPARGRARSATGAR